MLSITVGMKPNAPINLAVNEFVTATEIEVTWSDGAAIANNPPI